MMVCDIMNPLKSKKLLLQHLDNVFSLYIKKRDNYACVISGDKRNIELYHFINSDNFYIKYNTCNSFMLSKKLSAEFIKNPVPVLQYVCRLYGMDYFVTLSKTRNRIPTDCQIITRINEIVKLTDPIRDRRRWDD